MTYITTEDQLTPTNNNTKRKSNNQSDKNVNESIKSSEFSINSYINKNRHKLKNEKQQILSKLN